MKKRLLLLAIIFIINIFSIVPSWQGVAAEEQLVATLDKTSNYAGESVQLTIGYNCKYIVTGTKIQVTVPDGLTYTGYSEASNTPVDTVKLNGNVVTILQGEGEVSKTDLVTLSFTIDGSAKIGSKYTFKVTLLEVADDSYSQYFPNISISPVLTVVAKPTPVPTATPTQKPTATPTQKPTATPTQKPTATPTQKPTATPTQKPTATPTQKPTATPENTNNITINPSIDVQTPAPPTYTAPENYVTHVYNNQFFAVGYVDGSPFPGLLTLDISDITFSNEENADLIYETISEHLNGKTCVALYEIWLRTDTEIFIPEKIVSIRLSNIDRMNGFDNFEVLYITDTLEVNRLLCENTDGMMMFNNPNMGYFVLIGTEIEQNTEAPEVTQGSAVSVGTKEGISPGTFIISLILAVFVSLWIGVGIGYVIWGKNKKSSRYSGRSAGGWY